MSLACYEKLTISIWRVDQSQTLKIIELFLFPTCILEGKPTGEPTCHLRQAEMRRHNHPGLPRHGHRLEWELGAG